MGSLIPDQEIRFNFAKAMANSSGEFDQSAGELDPFSSPPPAPCIPSTNGVGYREFVENLPHFHLTPPQVAEILQIFEEE